MFDVPVGDASLDIKRNNEFEIVRKFSQAQDPVRPSA